MKPIEAYSDKRHCELCGALITEQGIDSGKDYPVTELIRKLAFLADKSPSLATFLIHYIAGRTEREIATKFQITHQAVHGRIARARKKMQKTMLPVYTL